MFQESVLSATYICSLQIPGNRLIPILLISSKSQVCVMTHGTGGADAVFPFTARRRMKEAPLQIKKCGRNTTPNTSSSDPRPAQSTRAVGREVCPLAEGPHRDQGGSCRAVCRWQSPGMKSCQVRQQQSTLLVSCIPSPLCKE